MWNFLGSSLRFGIRVIPVDNLSLPLTEMMFSNMMELAILLLNNLQEYSQDLLIRLN